MYIYIPSKYSTFYFHLCVHFMCVVAVYHSCMPGMWKLHVIIPCRVSSDSPKAPPFLLLQSGGLHALSQTGSCLHEGENTTDSHSVSHRDPVSHCVLMYACSACNAYSGVHECVGIVKALWTDNTLLCCSPSLPVIQGWTPNLLCLV